MKKILTIIGARPQFIKAAMISQALHSAPHLKEVIVHTGQHYDANMSQIFFDELAIPKVDYQLAIGSNTQGKQTGEMLAAIEQVILQEKPDCLLIYGDTNSTLAGALAAAKCHIPIAHVEAGLRSYNRIMPEEINRIVADQLSDILFTPTEQAVNNLKSEGYAMSRIIQVGDVMYDAALFYAEKAQTSLLKKLKLDKNNYLLATIHRAENTDNHKKLSVIFSALNQLAKIHQVVMPLHPRTRKSLEQLNKDYLHHTEITMIEPVGFLDMVMLEKNAALIITDSGGVQKEAYFYQIPCVTLRDETEWIETVKLGWNHLVGTSNVDETYQHISRIIGTKGITDQYPYGMGNAARLIVQHLSQGI